MPKYWKMKLAILLFALLGVSNALVPGMEYQYFYEGQIKVGMPEIRNRVAGAGIQCTINIQVHDDDDVAIKLTNIEVGEIKEEEVPCEMRGDLHFNYKKIQGNNKLLEDVYMIHPRREQGDVMETSKGEEVWISNVKRSIASLFLVVPIRNNFGEEESRESPDLLDVRSYGHSTVHEPSIFGHCASDYSMIPLNNTLGDPAARQQGPVYPHPWTNYEMSRTIDFDRCNVSVHTKQASMGNGTNSHLSQFGDVQSRHSVMRHNLTFDGQYFILQNGTNEGHFVVNPFAMNDEKIVSISNQTYHLLSSKAMGQKWSLPDATRILDTWYAEVYSPFSPGPDSPDYVRFDNKQDAKYEPLLEEQFWSGIDLADYQDSFKSNLDQALEEAAEISMREEMPIPEHLIGPFDTDSARLSSNLEVALRACRALDEDRLKQLFDKYYGDASLTSQIKLRLFIDALGASGAGAPHKVFLDKLNARQITVHRAASLFFSMPNNLISTPVVMEIGDYVKTLTLDGEEPFATSVIWINYANTVNKICVNSHRNKHTVPYQLYGKEHCANKEVIDSILPFFEQKLKSADKDWKQIILIHAIGNLGSSRAFSLLKSIAEDERLKSTVRVSAVYAISARKLDPSFRRYALRSFMSIAENRTDSIYVRQACILAILSWKPPRSWYQTLASDSWRENSQDMSSFTYFILKSYAESSDPKLRKQSEVARFFLPLTRPYAPSSRYSYSNLLSIFDSRRDLVTDFDVSSLRAGRYSDSVQRQVFALLVNSFGGYRFSVAQSSLSYDGREMSSILHKLTEFVSQDWKNVVRSAENRRTQLALQDVQKRMMHGDNSDSLSTYYFSMFDDMEVLLPLNKDAFSKAFGRDGSKFFKNIEYSSANLTKFINLGILSLGVPTELGLPLISRFSLPTFTGGPLRNSLLTCDGQKCTDIEHVIRAKEVRYDVEVNYRFASKSLTQVRVLLPWSERLVGTAVEALKGVNLPMNLTFKINRAKDDHRSSNISLSITPTTKDEITVAHIHTVPFVVTKNMFPSDSLNMINTQIISQKGTGEGSELLNVPINESYTGLYGRLRYEGDVSYPFTTGNAITFLTQPNLIPSLFTSPTCRLNDAALIVDFGKSPTTEMHSSTFINLGSFSMKPKGELPDFKFTSTLLFNGSETRYYETTVEQSEVQGSSSSQRHKTRFDIDFKRSKLPNFDNKEAAYCFELERDGPMIKNFDDLHTALQSSTNCEVKFSGFLKGGSGQNACDKSQIATFDGNFELSDERRQNLSSELDSVCSYDPNDPTVAFVTAPVYDRLYFDIKYKEPVPRAVQNATFHIYDFIRGYTFPHIYFNYMDQKNPRDQISIRGDRYLSEKRWKIDTKMPTESAKLDNFKMPSFMEDIVPVGGIVPTNEQHDKTKMLFESHLSNECILKRDKVRMFNGRSFDYKTDHCETVAVRDKSDADSPVALTHIENNEHELVLRFKRVGSTVKVRPNIMTVDNHRVELTHAPKDIKSSDGTVIGKAKQFGSEIIFEVPRMFRIRASDSRVSIDPSQSKKSHLSGLCGSYSGDKQMVGPQLCKYSDSQLFADSWTHHEGKECRADHYKEIQKKVKEYQKHCPKANHNKVHGASLISQYGKIPLDCIEFVYTIKRNGEALCVSQDVVAMCYPLCKLDKPRFYNEIYSCWSQDGIPPELLRNEKRGYIRHKIDKIPWVEASFETEHAFICSRK